jgi:hypothetical protein
MSEDTAMNIVLIEGNFTERTLLKDLLNKIKLRGRSINIYSSTEGVKGLDRVFKKKPDIFIVDVSSTSDYSESEIIIHLNNQTKAFKEITRIPVIVLNDENKYITSLSDDYIVFDKNDKDFLTKVVDFLEINILKLEHEHGLLPVVYRKKGLFRRSFEKTVLLQASRSFLHSIYAIRIHQKFLETKNIFKKSLLFILSVFAQLYSSLSLFIFKALVGKSHIHEENLIQKNIDSKKFYIKFLSGGLSAIFTALLFILILAGALRFLGNANPVVAFTRTWDGEGGDGLWSNCTNWSSNVCPTSADTVSFNVTNVTNSTIDSAFPGTIAVFNMDSGYTGTITMQRSFQVTGNFTQLNGNFNSVSYNLDIDGVFTLSGGSFTASSTTTSIAQALTVSGSPTFNHNSGTVLFDGASSILSCNNITFNAVSINASATKVVNSDCSLPIGNNPTITSVSLSGTLSGSGSLNASVNLT